MNIRPEISGRNSKISAAILLTLFFCLSIKSESLWTDEAFSAFEACHKSLHSLWHALLLGDSSDLQMWLYYCYLHLWTLIFGYTEVVLRAANIPFILIYSIAIVWTRAHLFRSNWVWISIFNPFTWAYAGDARPYMCIVSLSTVFVLCLVASFTDARYSRSKTLPWIALLALLFGLNLHMLMILLIPPTFIFILTYRLASNCGLPLKQWSGPLLWLAPLFLTYFVFLAWTFTRGTSYDYSAPDLLSMGSVLFRFAGLAGLAPNRHYAVPFAPYVPGMVITLLGMVAAGLMAVVPAVRIRHARTISLVAAVFVGVCEALVLSLIFKQQIEVRHLACLFALMLVAFFSVYDAPSSRRNPVTVQVSVVMVAAIWFISDFRLTFLPEYRREDFKTAISEALTLASNSEKAEIAVVADPAAAAYYRLGMTGDRPCFPLGGTCQEALSSVVWSPQHAAIQATFWTDARIKAWLQNSEKLDVNRIVIISRSRHPMYLNSLWWRQLRQTPSYVPTAFHGFFVYTSGEQKY